MSPQRYQVIPAGILVSTQGLGLHFTRKRAAKRTCDRLNKTFPIAGYQVIDLQEARP
jgi:hypothetical protein